METLFMINPRLRASKNVVIFGAGFYGKEMLQYFTDIGIKVNYWCDSNKKVRQRINNIEIISLETLVSLEELCVVIASTKAWKTINKKLLDLGVDQDNIISHVGLGNLFVLKDKPLSGQRLFIAGANVRGTQILLKLLRCGIYVQGFLDSDESLKGGKLLHKKIYTEDEIEDWESTALICSDNNTKKLFTKCKYWYVDDTYQGFLGDKLSVDGGDIYIWQLHDLERLCEGRKIAVYGTGTYAQNCCRILNLLDYEIDVFVESDEREEKVSGRRVLSVYDLMYEQDSYYLYVCVTSEQYEAVVNELGQLGYQEGFDFRPAWGRGWSQVFDPHLGYLPVTIESGKNYNGFVTFSAKNRGKKCKILILGGSTSDPYCIPVKSWCELLRDVCIHNGFNVEVITGGVMGYASAQELIKLIRDGLSIKPDIVISYSGTNDIFERGDYPFLNTYQLGLCTEFDRADEGLMSSRGLKKEGTSAYQNWKINVCMMHAILKEFGIPFIAVYQPNLWNKKGVLDAEEKVYKVLHKSLLVDRAGYEKAVENAIAGRELIAIDEQENTWIKNLTALFDNVSGVYVDVAHCSLKGNAMIAEEVFYLIKDFMKGFYVNV